MIKILIVDDEYIMRQGLKYMLRWEQEGYQIVGEASNGQEALEMVETLKPHIVISDIVMPVLDGADFTEVMYQLYPHIPMIILSGYDKFEYVKRTLQNGVVDYILKPTLNPEILLEVLKKAVLRIPDADKEQVGESVSCENLIERYLTGYDNTLDVSSFTKEWRENSYFHIYAVNLKKKNENGQNLYPLLNQKLIRELSNLNDISYSKVSFFKVSLREELAIVILKHESVYQQDLLKQIYHIHKQLCILCPDLFGVYSHFFNDLKELRNIYQKDIVTNIDKSFYYKNKNMLILEEVPIKKDMDKLVSENGEHKGGTERFLFAKYNTLLGNKQYEEALDMLEKYNEKALHAQMDIISLKNQIKNLIYLFLDFQKISDAEKENLRKNYFYQIEQVLYEEDYKEIMSVILQELSYIAENDVMQKDERLYNMLSYIDEHSKEDLTLEDVANTFGFSYHYLSTYFNQQMMESFSDYLNKIRIRKAGNLLKTSDTSIADISEKVGYSEQGYFSRVFKKMTGLTPSEWRRNADDKN